MSAEVTSVLFSEATPAQKRSYASTFLNLDLGADPSPDQVDAAIRTAQPNTEIIFVMADQAAEQKYEAAVAPPSTADRVPDSGVGSVGSLGHGDPPVTINIPVQETTDQSGQLDVMVGINGRAWQIRRGRDATVPYRVYLALKDAKGISINHDLSTGDETTRENVRFGFNVVEMPPKAEIAAWHERVDAVFCA